MDSSLYTQQSQSQSQYSSPLYLQHVYPQQQYQVYGIVPPTWTPSPTPYFETPLVSLVTLTLLWDNQHNSNLLCMTCTSVNSDCKLLEMIFTPFFPLCRLRFPTVPLWMDSALLLTTKLAPILWTLLAHLTETGKFFFFSDPIMHF